MLFAHILLKWGWPQLEPASMSVLASDLLWSGWESRLWQVHTGKQTLHWRADTTCNPKLISYWFVALQSVKPVFTAGPRKNQSHTLVFVTFPLCLASLTCSLLAVGCKVWSDDAEIAKWITSFLWRGEVRWFYRIADRITPHLIFDKLSLKIWFAHFFIFSLSLSLAFFHHGWPAFLGVEMVL